MYDVVLAVDRDEDQARLVADAVASLPGDVDVLVLNVFEEFTVSDGEARVESDDIYDDESFPDSVDVVGEILDSAGIEPTERREHGEPTETILAVADEIDADLIAVGGRKRSPTGKAIFGSVTQSLLLSADRPVIVATTE